MVDQLFNPQSVLARKIFGYCDPWSGVECGVCKRWTFATKKGSPILLETAFGPVEILWIDFLPRRHCHAISRHNLGLIAKDFAASCHPHSPSVFQSASQGIEKWLVHPEIMRVAANIRAPIDKSTETRANLARVV